MMPSPLQELKHRFSTRQERTELLSELAMASTLPLHPNVVRHIRGWQEARILHLQLELCAGGSVHTLLRRGELGSEDGRIPESVLWVILQCAPVATIRTDVPRACACAELPVVMHVASCSTSS